MFALHLLQDFKLAFRLAGLDPDTYAVLSVLKSDGPITEQEVTDRLRKLNGNWSQEAVREALEALKAMPMQDGTIRQLVAQDDQERWQTSGV